MRLPDQHTALTRAERGAVALLFVVLIGISVAVVYRLGTDDAYVVGPPEERPTVDPSVARPMPLRFAFDIAYQWAREWHGDAWPILVSAQFEFPPDGGSSTPEATGGAYIFTFAGPKAGGAWPRLSVAVGRESGTIYYEDEIESEIEPPASIEAMLAGLPIGAGQAFEVADRVVGADYRAGCAPSRRQVQVVLDATDRNAPAWVVVYFDQRDRSTNDIVVRIDANTGATSTTQRDGISCDMSEG